MFLSKFEIDHPYFWFTSFFSLYNVAYLIIYLFYKKDRIIVGYSKEYIIILIIGLLSFLLSSGMKRYPYENRENILCKKKYIRFLLEYLLYLFIIICFICIFKFTDRGFTSKQQMWEVYDTYYIIGAYCTRYITLIISLFIVSGIPLKKIRLKIFLSILIVLIYSLFTSERDAIFRIILVIFFSFFIKKYLRKKSIFIFIPLGIFFMIMMTYLKYYFVNGSLDNKYLNSSYQIIYLFLYSDFAQCGANFQILLNNPFTKGIFNILIIFSSLVGAILPARISQILFNGVYNTSVWYNNTFFPNSSWNRDFSLIGEGYLIGGKYGVVFLFFILGIITRIIYKFSSKSEYNMSFYIYFLVGFISAFRSNLLSLFSSVVRIPLSLFFLLYIFDKIYIYIKKLTKENNVK